MQGKFSMRISQKTRDELYGAIFEEITSARIKLKLNPEQDLILLQVESSIWDKQKQVLKLPACSYSNK